MEPWKQISYNILGGIIVAILTALWIKLRFVYQGRQFKKIFGKDVKSDFFISYALLNLSPSFDEEGVLREFPYHKPGTSGIFKISTPVSVAETRAAGYLSGAFSENFKYSPKLVSDVEIAEKLDISYCSFGGYNNLKTMDVLEDEDNNFFSINIEPPGGIDVKGKGSKNFSNYENYDHGIIVKIKPTLFPERVWIAVAGVGEWGTSGAAWFLAKKWKEIVKIAGDNSFGVIVRVKAGKDESAHIVHHIVNKA